MISNQTKYRKDLSILSWSYSERVVCLMVTEIDGFVDWWGKQDDKSSEMA